MKARREATARPSLTLIAHWKFLFYFLLFFLSDLKKKIKKLTNRGLPRISRARKQYKNYNKLASCRKRGRVEF